jgi:tetratricopeptide (TPR) repeat protein
MAMPPSRRPFVGRDRELEEIGSGLAEAAAGHGLLFFIVGAAGIGKTRLADEIARAAEARGFRPVWGRCWETEGAPAYWPWMQILRELTRGDEGRADLVAALGDSSARLLAPLLAATGGEGAVDSDPAQARFRLFDAAVALLRVAAERTPLVIVLDDLHAADPSSLALLHFLARNLRGVRALVLGSYRDEEARVTPDVGRALSEIAREGAYLPLGPLGRGDVAQLVAAAAGPQPDDALVDLVERAGEGNPLFLGELLRLLTTPGEAGHGLRPGARLPVPDTVKEVIGRRIARLPPETRAALGAASVVGRAFTTGVAAQVAGLLPAALERNLGEAEQTGLLLAPAPGRWRFAHVLMREVLYRDLDPARRTEAHLAVAGALEASPLRHEAIAEIAHHRLTALPLGDVGAAAAAARAAAARAMAMLAFEDAAASLERAREVLEALPAPRDDRALCELTLLAALARMRGGDVERGRRSCLEAAAEARRLGSGDLLARAALGYGAEVILAVSDPTLVALLEEALAMLPAGAGGLRAQCLARLAAARQPADNPEEPLVMARQAVAMARALGDDEVLRPVLAAAGSALADYAPPVERAPVSEELARLAGAAGDRPLVLRAQARLVIDYFEMGALDRCARAIEAYEALAREFRQPRHLWPGRLMRSMLASTEGRFDEAERIAEEAQAIAPDAPMFRLAAVWRRVGHALLCEREGELAQAERGLPTMFDIALFTPFAEDFVNLSLASLRARAGDRDSARRHLMAVPPASHFYRYEYGVMTTAAEAVVLVADQALAALVYERLAAAKRCLGSGGSVGMSCWGVVDGARAMLAQLLGRRAEAAELFQTALAVVAPSGARPVLAQLQHRYAEFLRTSADPAERARAEGMAAEALALAEALGLRLLAARLRHPASATDVQVPPAAPVKTAPPAGQGPGFSLSLEGEYWTVTAAGEVCRLKDGRGIRMLAQLCAHPGREFHVLALMGATGDEEADAGDAGPLLDEQALADYRARLHELDAELAEAQQWRDTGRLERLGREREAIAAEVARGVGLGGRARRAGSATERARTNVQRRIRKAIQKIGETLPALAAYLDRAVKTGTFCSYDPF